MRALISELRSAARRLRRRPALTLVVIATLAGAVAINATLASAVNAMLFRPLPVENPEEIVRIFERSREGRIDRSLSWEQFDLARRGGVLSAAAAFAVFDARVKQGAAQERIAGELVTPSFFETLGVPIARGRAFLPSEGIAAGDAPVAVIGTSLAERLFGEEEPIGRTIEINDVSFTIIGIADRRFRGTSFALTREIWIPASMRGAVSASAWPGSPDDRWLSILARLPAGASLTSAEELLNASVARTRGAGRGWSFRVLPERVGAINPETPGAVRLAAGAVLGIGAAFLLVACANTAGLLLARLAARTRELGIRIALGADRARLAREGLAESAILVTASALIGLAAAAAATRALPALLPSAAAHVTIDFSPDWRVAGSTMIAATLVVVLFSLLPLVHVRRIDVVAMLAGRKGRERRGRPDAVVAIAAVQVAFALATLVIAALFVQSMLRYQRLDPGFAHEHRLAVRVDPGDGSFATMDRLESLRERIEATPGIRHTAFAAGPPLGQLASAVTIEGVEPIRIDSTAVGPGYFEVLEISLREGRGFLRSDGPAGAPVAIVNETFARRRNAGVGTTLRLAQIDRPVEIVGIVADSKIVALAELPAPHLYVPVAQRPVARPTLLIELAASGTSVAAVREVIEADLGLGSVASITSLDAIVDADRQFARVGAATSITAAMAGTLLSMLALWSILAATVARSKRELAIRIAVGAGRRHVIAAASRRAIRALAIGGSFGTLLALAASRTLTPLLVPDGSAWWSLAVPFSIISILAVFAAWGPVRHALALHPATSLRNE